MGSSKNSSKRKFIAIQAYLKKQDKSQINNLTLHLKELEKEEQTKHKVRRTKEIIKIRAEKNEIETKKTIANINKTKSCFIENINRIDKPLARLIKEQRERAQINKIRNEKGGAGVRWWKSKTRRSPSSPQIHQKYIYTWNCSYRTPTEHWQKTSDLPKGKKLPTYLGRVKEKRNNTDKRIGTGPAPVVGSCGEGKVSTQ